MPAGRAVIGGFHLIGRLSGGTVTAPGQLATDVIIPAADWNATHATARLHGAFIQNNFGTAVQPPPWPPRDDHGSTTRRGRGTDVAHRRRRQPTFGPRIRDFRP